MSGPTIKTIKHLFAFSGNQCAFPGCTFPLMVDEAVLGEICHITAQNAAGPRYDPAQTEKERHGFENLLLLCPTHHKVVDDNPGKYTVERLRDIKRKHEESHTVGLDVGDLIVRKSLVQFETQPGLPSSQPRLRGEFQRNPVADPVSALIAVVRPILQGTLYALKEDIVQECGGYENIKLKMLARVYRQGDGDCGLCFEYAVHDALSRHNPMILERVHDALRSHCRIGGTQPASILFGAEKAGALQLIATAKEMLTDESLLMAGSKGRPVKLKKHIDSVAAAFRRPVARKALPHSISGLWKADLFIGYQDSDRWVGTSVKINPRHLEPAKGLRIGIVPSLSGTSDSIRTMNDLVVCPLPYDGSFMEIFYRGWGIVQQFIAADAKMPKEVNLPRPDERQVASYLADRREFGVLEVMEALDPLSQPELLGTETETEPAVTYLRHEADSTAGAIIAPFPSKSQS